MTVREVVITQPFWLAFDAQADYFESLRHQFPDAGARLERLEHDLFNRIIPLLGHSADIGRPYPLDASLLADLNVVGATAREYVDAQFNILYVVTPARVFLVNLRNHKQLAY